MPMPSVAITLVPIDATSLLAMRAPTRQALRHVIRQIRLIDHGHEKLIRIVDAVRIVRIGHGAHEVVVVRDDSVCLSTPPTCTSGPNARLSSFAGISVTA